MKNKNKNIKNMIMLSIIVSSVSNYGMMHMVKKATYRIFSNKNGITSLMHYSAKNKDETSDFSKNNCSIKQQDKVKNLPTIRKSSEIVSYKNKFNEKNSNHKYDYYKAFFAAFGPASALICACFMAQTEEQYEELSILEIKVKDKKMTLQDLCIEHPYVSYKDVLDAVDNDFYKKWKIFNLDQSSYLLEKNKNEIMGLSLHDDRVKAFMAEYAHISPSGESYSKKIAAHHAQKYIEFLREKGFEYRTEKEKRDGYISQRSFNIFYIYDVVKEEHKRRNNDIPKLHGITQKVREERKLNKEK